MTGKQDTGARAESCADAFLRTLGFQILDKNVRTPYGEIDLVCRENKTLVFVEVRYRASVTFGQPEDTVLGRKMTRMRQSAEWYVSQHRINSDYRLDVIGITGEPAKITHIIDAS
jgi:putative endonuclease